MALDHQGLHVDRPTAISTWTRKRVDPLALEPADVCIEDIAHALARQCRYNGHVGGFLSVARHSLNVADVLKFDGHDDKMQLAGLLHDAAETYLGDLVHPLKHSAELEAFRKADDRADQVIAEAFDVPWPQSSEVHDADRKVLFRELDVTRWTYRSTPERDEADFLKRYRSLTGTPVQCPRPICGLVGFAGAGKDTAALGLTALGWRRHAFADALKRVASQVGWNGTKDETGRVLLQDLGMAVREQIDPDAWVRALEREIDQHRLPVVITDVRFLNEVDWIKSRGGIIVRVDRPGVGPVNGHPSEHDWRGVDPDLILTNDGDPDDLADELATLVC